MESANKQITGKEREKWIKRNAYYYNYLVKYLKFIIPENASVLEIGSGTGFLLEALNPARGVGIDSSESKVNYARETRGSFTYHVMNGEDFTLDETFDFVLISDSVGDFRDVQKVFERVQKVCTPQTRIVITTINFLWFPLLNLGEKVGLKNAPKETKLARR